MRCRAGSAILLTTTLPLAQRAALTRAFGEGAELQLPQGTPAKGSVAVRRLETAQQALDLITET